jgi:hypothetical protein
VQREAVEAQRKIERNEHMKKSKAELKRLFPCDVTEPQFVLYKDDVPSWLILAASKRNIHHQWFRNPRVLHASESLEWLIIAKDQAILEHRIARLLKRGAKGIAAFEKKREEERQAQEG